MKEDELYDSYGWGTINRFGITVRPKLPFLEWLNTVQSESPVKFEDVNHPCIYLIDAKDDVADIENWLKRNSKSIFYRELFSWHTEASDYPENVDFKLFKEWFDYEPCDSVADLGKTEIEAD